MMVHSANNSNQVTVGVTRTQLIGLALPTSYRLHWQQAKVRGVLRLEPKHSSWGTEPGLVEHPVRLQFYLACSY